MREISTVTRCSGCGSDTSDDTDSCHACGQPLSTRETPSPSTRAPLRLSRLSVTRDVLEEFTLTGDRIAIGREDGDLTFPNDSYVSPVHAMLSRRNGELFLRDLGARNGTWLFIDAPTACRTATPFSLVRRFSGFGGSAIRRRIRPKRTRPGGLARSSPAPMLRY